MAATRDGKAAEDRLFADLGIDPGKQACQSYEAVDFLAGNRPIDPTSAVVLWRIGAVAGATLPAAGHERPAFALLLERLLRIYPPGHAVYLHEAAASGGEPTILPTTLQMLEYLPKTAAQTLYVPPA